MQKRGEALGALLDELIDNAAGDDGREGVMARMGRAAGISASTVGQIVNGSIECPPLTRLEGFARVLNVSVGRLISAAERDGCEYERQLRSHNYPEPPYPRARH